MNDGTTPSIQKIKRRIYFVGFPLGVVVALGLAYAGWHQETPQLADAIGQPLFALLLAVLTIGLWRNSLSLRRVEYGLFTGIVLMQLASLVYSAIAISGNSARLWDLTTTSIWGFVIYTLAFLVLGVHTGLKLSSLLALLSTAVWLAYLFMTPASPLGIWSLFFQIHAVGGVQILLLYGFGQVISLQAHESATHELEAHTDPLTRLGNRRYLTEHMEQEIARSQRTGETFSVVILDIDHFKMVNDRYGHNAGDQALVQVGQTLLAHARKMDFVSRWGGEEFLVILPTSASGEAAEVAERFRTVLSQQSFGEVGSLTASFGVAEYWPGEGAEACIQRADEALYQAKATGRDRVMLYERPYLPS